MNFSVYTVAHPDASAIPRLAPISSDLLLGHHNGRGHIDHMCVRSTIACYENTGSVIAAQDSPSGETHQTQLMCLLELVAKQKTDNQDSNYELALTRTVKREESMLERATYFKACCMF
jgi:hypothetical protein